MEAMRVPDTLPVMILPETVLFPQALIPLYIFEPRYRQMLHDVLARDRLFALACLDRTQADQPGLIEPTYSIATVGIIRACQEAENDTANLLLQGLCRIQIQSIVREHPYRLIAVQPLVTVAGAMHNELEVQREEIMRLLNLRRRLGTPAPKGITQFLNSIEDIDAFADLVVFNLCTDDILKQQLLAELDTCRRLQRFAHQLKTEIEEQKFRRKLQGHLPDDHISDN